MPVAGDLHVDQVGFEFKDAELLGRQGDLLQSGKISLTTMDSTTPRGLADLSSTTAARERASHSSTSSSTVTTTTGTTTTPTTLLPLTPIQDRMPNPLNMTFEDRLVQKHGGYNIDCWTKRKDRCRLLADIFTTLIELRWRYIALLFIGSFTVSWLTFGLAWWGIVVVHEDHLHENDTDWRPCLSNVYSLPDALLFSIDLQSTMGYGFGEIETACPGAIAFFMLQSVFGVFIECVATGIVFSKLIRPKRRFRTIMFSERAVIFRQSDGQLVLQFRVGDMRKRCLIAASISAVLVKLEWTSEGEQLPLCHHALKLSTESDNNEAFLLWPETITHIINEASPLWGLAADALTNVSGDAGSFEIIVILEGTDDTTGMATQLRTSYLPSEIMWGHRLIPLVIRPLSNGDCLVDYSLFNDVYKDDDAYIEQRDDQQMPQINGLYSNCIDVHGTYKANE